MQRAATEDRDTRLLTSVPELESCRAAVERVERRCLQLEAQAAERK